MAIPKIFETELKFAALSSAMTEMLASLSYENAVLRDFLEKRGYFSRAEYEKALKDYGRAAWETHRGQAHHKIQELMAAALDRMKGGTVH
jgi:hypothetical protein